MWVVLGGDVVRLHKTKIHSLLSCCFMTPVVVLILNPVFERMPSVVSCSLYHVEIEVTLSEKMQICGSSHF